MQSSKGTTILILGIVGFVCCPICAPIAWSMGNKELKAIREGTTDPSGQGTAKAGMILGIIGSIFLIFWLLWVLLFGGLAVIGSMMGNH